MAKRGRMCVVPECERQVSAGALVCGEHRETALGKELGREVAVLANQMRTLQRAEHESDQREAARAFRQQVLRGEYAALFSGKFHEMVQTAGEEPSMQGEIGMLRQAMVRVLTEEENPSRMAHALAKLSFALGRAVKQEGERTEAGRGDPFSELLEEIMGNLPPNPEEVAETRPWELNPHDPPRSLKREMAREGIEAGSYEVVPWMERWIRRETERLAGEGSVEALRVLGMGEG